jgi:hypothetical protein
MSIQTTLEVRTMQNHMAIDMIASSYSRVIVSLLASLPSSILFFWVYTIRNLGCCCALALPVAQLHGTDQRLGPTQVRF